MKLLKPSWVNHDDKPIFSVDIHPTGKRFATGGQGGDSGRVVVWNLNPVLYESAEVDPNVPKMLCQMDNHLACVNCVRWSNGGKFLASGGDDRLVMVWGLSVAGAPGKHKVETWRCLHTLRGHAVEALGGKALPCIVDVRDEKQVQKAIDEAVKQFNGIDILVNNASAISLASS